MRVPIGMNFSYCPASLCIRLIPLSVVFVAVVFLAVSVARVYTLPPLISFAAWTGSKFLSPLSKLVRFCVTLTVAERFFGSAGNAIDASNVGAGKMPNPAVYSWGPLALCDTSSLESVASRGMILPFPSTEYLFPSGPIKVPAGSLSTGVKVSLAPTA